MTDNITEYIQLRVEHPSTNFIIYEGEKYPINFNAFKASSKYFYERRHEIVEDEEIDLTKYDPEDNITHLSADEVVSFIKYIQLQPVKLTKENVIGLHYFGEKYEIDQLKTSTDKYIKEHFDEVLLKFLKRKELRTNIDSNYYEEQLATNLRKYLKEEELYSLDISSLYRILDKASKKEQNEFKDNMKNEFLMKILSKRGRSASILFKYADIESFEYEALSRLLTEYSTEFEFEFITESVLKIFLKQKKLIEEERQKHSEENQANRSKCSILEKELEEERKQKEEMKKLIEEERKQKEEMKKLIEEERQKHSEENQANRSKCSILEKELEEERKKRRNESERRSSKEPI